MAEGIDEQYVQERAELDAADPLPVFRTSEEAAGFWLQRLHDIDRLT